MCMQTRSRCPSTEHATGTGRRRPGFTLVELMVVMLILTLLASIASPLVARSIQRAREATLKETLLVTRRAIDDYYSDTGSYPQELSMLVEKRYLRRPPTDPFTDREGTWKLMRMQENNGKDVGIVDLHSSSEGQSVDGSHYTDW